MKIFGSIILITFFAAGAHSETEFPAQARLFIGTTSVKPEQLNTEMNTQGIKQFDNVTKYGVEITYSLTKFVDVGLNYTKHWQRNLEGTPTPGQSYNALIDQDTVQAIARIPFLRTDFVRLDAFGGIGGSNTTFKIISATQNGELSRREGKDWFANPVFSYGGSLALGYKKFYLVFEGGIESNKVSGFKRSGIISNNVQEINLSGGYFQVGLMFDGVTATKK